MSKIHNIPNELNFNSNNVKKSTFFNSEHIVVEGVCSMIAGTVMNGVLYDDELMEDLVKDIPEMVHSPLSHPTGSDGEFILAGTAEAVHRNYVSAFSYNYRIVGDKLIHDLAIDPVKASMTKKGAELVRKIENKEKIDTSTGFIILNKEYADGYGKCGTKYSQIARKVSLDHDAILMDEIGAATNIQGVGIYANNNDDLRLLISSTASNITLNITNKDFNESEAIEGIKEFTGSTDKPNTNYRRFFLYFDPNNLDSFDGYLFPFVSIIDGKPLASIKELNRLYDIVKDSNDIDAASKAAALSVIDFYNGNGRMFANSQRDLISSFYVSDDTDPEVVNEVIRKAREKTGDIYPIDINNNSLIFKNNTGNLFKLMYNRDNGSTVIDNNVIKLNVNFSEVDEMKELIVKALAEAGLDIEGKSDEELLAMFKGLDGSPDANKADNLDGANEADKASESDNGDKADEAKEEIKEVADDAAEAVADKVDAVDHDDEFVSKKDLVALIAEAIKDALSSKESDDKDKSKEELADEVSKINVGINKTEALAMNSSTLKNILNSNSGLAFNASACYNSNTNRNHNELPE